MLVWVIVFACLVGTKCRVTADDNGYPRGNTAKVSGNSSVTRHSALPKFTNIGYYKTTINDDEDVQNSIIRVSASRQGLIGHIVYEGIGDYPTPTFFGVDEDDGEVRVIQDLRTDVFRNENYILRVQAYDSGAPKLSATAKVLITVLRNFHSSVSRRISE